MVETSVTIAERHAWFARAEAGRKPAHDLDVGDAEDAFAVGKFQGGYVRYWDHGAPGCRASAAACRSSVVPAGLAAVYGGRATPGVGVFVTMRPAAMVMADRRPPIRTRATGCPEPES